MRLDSLDMVGLASVGVARRDLLRAFICSTP